MNLGYACINTLLKSNGIFTNRTMRRKTFDSKGLDYCFRIITSKRKRS